MTTTTTGSGTPSGLTTSWLATRLGQQPARIEALRRAGMLLGVPRADGQRVFPSWQFGRDGRPLPSLPRVIAAGRAAGLDDGALHRLVTMREGMTGGRRLVEALRSGTEEPVLRAIARAAS
jgi:hypothetical protein